MKHVRPIAVVILGIALIVLGCQTQMVGTKDLHTFLIAAGIIGIIVGGWELL